MKSNEYWGLYNGSCLWCVEKTKKQCRSYAESLTGGEWEGMKDWFVFKKVRIIEIAEWSNSHDH